jgi:hypothetical protein
VSDWRQRDLSGQVRDAARVAPEDEPRYRDTYRNRERRRLAYTAPLHPRTGLPLSDMPGARCGTCRSRVIVGTHAKCAHDRDNWTTGRASDVLLRWPGCILWEAADG